MHFIALVRKGQNKQHNNKRTSVTRNISTVGSQHLESHFYPKLPKRLSVEFTCYDILIFTRLTFHLHFISFYCIILLYLNVLIQPLAAICNRPLINWNSNSAGITRQCTTTVNKETRKKEKQTASAVRGQQVGGGQFVVRCGGHRRRVAFAVTADNKR